MTDSQRGERSRLAIFAEFRRRQGTSMADDMADEIIRLRAALRATEAAPSGAAQPDGWMLLRDGKRVSVNNTDWWAIESKDLKHNGGRYEVVPLYRVAPSPSGPGEAQAGNKIVQPCGCCTYSLQARHLCPEHTNMVDIDV